MNAPSVFPEFAAWFEQNHSLFDAVVLDIDGVMIRGHLSIPSSLQFLDQLRKLQVPFVLLTNDGSNSHQEKSRLLTAAGIHVSPEEIISASDGLMDLIREQPDLKDRLFYVIGRLGDPCYATSAGLQVTRDLADLSDCSGVIVGEENYEWEPVFHGVVNWLRKNPDRRLIVPNPDEYYMVASGDIKIGAGAFARFMVRTLESAHIIIKPVYLGKPYHPIFRRCHAELETRLQKIVSRERVIVVGDSLASDVQGAKTFGYRAALVLTGVTSLPMLAAGRPQPDWVFKSV